MVRQLQLVLGLMVCFAAKPVDAELMTFFVNHSGTDAVTGATLRVFGTLMVDPFLPISNMNPSVHDGLYFQRNAQEIIPLVPPPVFIEITEMIWEVSGGNLYVTRVGSAQNSFLLSSAGIYLGGFRLGSGSHPHELISSTAFPIGVSERVVLKNPGPPDGPNGFLVGTAIPEPSSALLVAGISAALSMHRRRGFGLIDLLGRA